MLDLKKRAWPRVSVSHEGRRLVIKIPRRNGHFFEVLSLATDVVMCGVLGWAFVPRILGLRLLPRILCLVFVALPCAALFYRLIRRGLRAAFGEEEIWFGGGTLVLLRRLLGFSHTIELGSGDVSGVTVKPLPGGWGEVSVATEGKTYKIGDMILKEEAEQIGEELKHALAGIRD